MTVSIHQPHFFPWLGYFHKIIQSEVFVLLDDVQFEKNYFQNRTQIKNLKGEPFWLGVPVQKAPLTTHINQIKIAPVFKPQSMIDTLRQFYRKAPYFNTYFQEISDILLSDNQSLFEINYKTLIYTLGLLDIETKLFISSEMNILEVDPNLRLIEICRKVSADTYLAGKGGKKYMDLDVFNNADIKVNWQNFNPDKIIYPQVNGDFIPGLSVLDVLFNMGHEETLKLIQNV